MRSGHLAVPAQAGTHVQLRAGSWMPACAGMTNLGPAVPAQAGTQGRMTGAAR